MSKKPQNYQLKVLSQTDNLELIREFVSKIAQKIGLNETDINKIELAVDEACANVIQHAYDPAVKFQPLHIAIEVDYQKLTVIVTDQGKGFDFSKIKPIEMNQYLAEMKVGGLGIHLIKSLMDEVEFEIHPGKKNQVRMVKYFLGKKGEIVHSETGLT
ncbi:ATP-binding protein [candidate division KSB1 bacterium]|nr:ATP-binding protein [candidate division KSB1 bacterium]